MDKITPIANPNSNPDKSPAPDKVPPKTNPDKLTGTTPDLPPPIGAVKSDS